jgi:hypothetical protein
MVTKMPQLGMSLMSWPRNTKRLRPSLMACSRHVADSTQEAGKGRQGKAGSSQAKSCSMIRRG